MLKRMRRKYTTEEFYNKMLMIHKAMPDVAITTDVIVGFPGRRTKCSAMAITLMKKIGFSEMHVFPYSKRKQAPLRLVWRTPGRRCISCAAGAPSSIPSSK